MLLTDKKSSTIFFDLLTIIVGTAITAVAINRMIIPAGFISGGLTGISQFIHHFIPIKIGVLYFLLNIPLMIIGYKYLGKKFSIYTVIAFTILSTFLYFIPVKFLWTENPLLAAIFGGTLNGIGCGIVLRRGGSQGGIDILSRVIARQKNISVGKFNLIVNVIIVLVSGFIFDSEIALYTIISMFTSMKTYGVVLSHVNRISVLIITDKGEEVNTEINKILHRGTTMWDASGGYTHDKKMVLLCVIVEGQLVDVKKIVRRIDTHSFISVLSTQNVIGRFNQIW